MDLIKQYRILHDLGLFPGVSTLNHKHSIKNLIDKHKATTLLDYGAGKGLQYRKKKFHEKWGVTVTCYDPAVDAFSNLPEGKFHGVICVDVLEHIPREEIKDTLERIYAYADRFVFLTICTREAKKKLPDGRNVHLTIEDEDWWRTLVNMVKTVDTEIRFNE